MCGALDCELKGKTDIFVTNQYFSNQNDLRLYVHFAFIYLKM